MTTLETFRQTCRRDRNVAYAALGVSFWLLLATAFLASHAVLDVLTG